MAKASEISDDAVFHCVVLEVTVTEGGRSDTTVLRSPAANGEWVKFDISSVLRSMAAHYTYTYMEMGDESHIYSALAYDLKAYDEYLLEGTHNTSVGIVEAGSYSAIRGGFTSLERYEAGSTLAVEAMSRKPLKGEVCAVGERYLAPVPYDAPQAVTGALEILPMTVGVDLVAEGSFSLHGRTIYVEAAQEDRVMIQFVNRRGCLESISCRTLPSVTIGSSHELLLHSAAPQFAAVATSFVRRTAPQRKLKLSTGIINEEWAEWWMSDPLQSDKGAWICLDGKWLPCLLEVAGSVVIADAASNDALSIPFTATIML